MEEQDTELYVCHDYEDEKSRWAGSKTDNGNKVNAASARLGRGITDGLLFFPLVSVFCNVVILLYNEKHIYFYRKECP